MSATSKTFQLTETSSGTAFDMSSDNLIYVIASGSGASVTFNNDGAANKVVVVDETPAAIATASQWLIAVTIDVTVDSSAPTLYINADRVIEVITARSTEANILYDDNGANNKVILVDQSRATIRTAISAIVGAGSGSVVTGLTAFAGGGQASATQLSFGYNEVTTVATTGDSVKLQAAQAGAQIEVLNDGANPMDVYPATGDTINDGGANAAISVAPGVTVTFIGIDSTNWETTSQTVSIGNGTVALPSMSFNSDPDTGMYRIASNNIGFAVNGAKVLDIKSTGLGITGEVRYSGLQVGSSTTAIPAFATGGQASATLLTTGYNEITVCATAGDSVKLPALGATAAGTMCTVKNNGATAADVFPNTSDSINALGANTAVRLAPGATISFSAVDAIVWEASNEILATEDGAVGTPSHTFSTQPDMGSYKISATQQGQSVGGALVGGFETGGMFTDTLTSQTTNANLNLAGRGTGRVLIADGLILEQVAPTAKTTSAVITAAEILTGIITVNQGAGGASVLTTDTGTNIDAALTIAVDQSFDMILVNTSVVGAEDASIAAGAGVTLVGNMNVTAADAIGAASSARFRFRKTAANAFTVYRIG